MNESHLEIGQESKEFRNLPLEEKWRVPSELTGINTFRDKFESLISNINQSWIIETDVFGLTLGFDEALVNAIKYGNKEDLSQEVTVNVTIDTDKLEVIIQDNNPDPFSPNTAFNSVNDEAEKFANHGRGITLMKEMYDSVTYEFMDPGNKVTLTKKNHKLIPE